MDYDADVVFLGDSIIEHGEWQHAFPSHKVINLGVGGNSIERVSDRVEMVTAIHPNKTFVLASINNYWWFNDEAHMKYLYEDLAAELQESGTQDIYLISVLPITEEAEKRLGISNSAIDTINDRIKEVCEKEDITYIDANIALSDEVCVNPQYTESDGLHLSKEGYEQLYSILKPYVDDNEAINQTK